MGTGRTQQGEHEDPLWEWTETMQPRLARLNAFEVPGLPLDYSPESLGLLEAEVLNRDPLGRGLDGLAEAVVGYVGEALMRVAGGRWGWDETSGTPFVDFDPQLGLPPIAPHDLIVEAGKRRSGTEFVSARESLQRAVEKRRAADASWSPTKQPTPGLDDPPVLATSTFLRQWLAEREKAFPQWVADYAPGTSGWDFSAASLDLLEAVVLAKLQACEDMDRPENADFVQGAIWYLGETFRHEGGAEWTHVQGEPSPTDFYTGRPYVKRLNPRNDDVPYWTLWTTIGRVEPGYLRGRLEFFNSR
ncbi:MAG TPA: hypothetical protein VF062_18445 [Candidatus Limnocylindrales bacterium]